MSRRCGPGSGAGSTGGRDARHLIGTLIVQISLLPSFLFSLSFFTQRHKDWVNGGVKSPCGANSGGGTKNKNGSVAAAALIERC